MTTQNPVHASDHAVTRARMRHPDRFERHVAPKVEQEVSAALREGRLGPDVPDRFLTRKLEGNLAFAWSPGYERVYVVCMKPNVTVVLTVLPKIEEKAEAA